MVAVSADSSLYTWLLGAKGKQAVVVGPEYVSDFEEKAGASSLLIERPYEAPSCGQVIVYGRGEPQHLTVKADPSVDAVAPPELGEWQMAASREASPTSMTPNGKHRTTLCRWARTATPARLPGIARNSRPTCAGTGTLHLDGADNVAVFVNGQLAAGSKHHGSRWDVEVPVTAGTNTVAVFTSHAGREKAFGYLGALPDYHPKGLFGPVTLTLNGRDIAVNHWSMRGGVDPTARLRRGTGGGGRHQGRARHVPHGFRASKSPGKPGRTPFTG